LQMVATEPFTDVPALNAAQNVAPAVLRSRSSRGELAAFIASKQNWLSGTLTTRRSIKILSSISHMTDLINNNRSHEWRVCLMTRR
jgi:hypothetical protein